MFRNIKLTYSGNKLFKPYLDILCQAQATSLLVASDATDGRRAEQ